MCMSVFDILISNNRDRSVIGILRYVVSELLFCYILYRCEVIIASKDGKDIGTGIYLGEGNKTPSTTNFGIKHL